MNHTTANITLRVNNLFWPISAIAGVIECIRKEVKCISQGKGACWPFSGRCKHLIHGLKCLYKKRKTC